MKYFIDADGCKVGLYHCARSGLGEYIRGWDAKGNEHHIRVSDIIEDDEQEYVEVSIPIEFPKEFVPGIKFHEDRCMWCPFFCVEEVVGCYCDHKHYEKQGGCPIRKYFIIP